MSLSKVAYQRYLARFHGEEFAVLKAAGARAQFLLWASTGTKNKAYSDVLYVESLIGDETVNTVPDATLALFRDHGNAAATLARAPTRRVRCWKQRLPPVWISTRPANSCSATAWCCSKKPLPSCWC